MGSWTRCMIEVVKDTKFSWFAIEQSDRPTSLRRGCNWNLLCAFIPENWLCLSLSSQASLFSFHDGLMM